MILPTAALILVLQLQGNWAHIRLTYPAARKYDFDYLVNVNVPGACAMPRNLGRVTNLQAGSTLNVTWNTGATNEGGIRVELMDQNYNMLATLAPTETQAADTYNDVRYFGNNPTAIQQTVTLPRGVTCNNCVLRLQKLLRIPESGVPIMAYYSCADVNVVERDTRQDCSGRGQWRNNRCECRAPFVGNVCQFEAECTRDQDCSSNGRCVDTNFHNFPKRQCFCNAGFFGLKCEQRSPVASVEFDSTQYRMQVAPRGNYTLYWRILEESEEIEMVIEARTRNWVAVGWRPFGLDAKCKQFPIVQPEIIATGPTSWKTVDFYDTNFPFMTAPIHPMACTDVVFATARGGLSRVRDMYSRDMSTPRDDSVYDGAFSLTAAVAAEDPASGNMTVIFRKKLAATEQADHSIVRGPMHVIWAIGQEPFDPTGVMPSQPARPTNADLVRIFPRKSELTNHNRVGRGHWILPLRPLEE